MNRIRNFLRCIFFHQNPVRRLTILAIYLGCGIVANFVLFQVFCVPVFWAGIAFWISILNLAFFHWIATNPNFRYIGLFLLGFGIPIWIYLAAFLGDPLMRFSHYLEFLLLSPIGFGLLGFLPLYLLQQAIRYVHAAGSRGYVIAGLGALMPLLVFWTAIRNFATNQRLLNSSLQASVGFRELSQTAPRNYYTERLCGIAFKYHTNLEYVFDGWRPPLHDPLLNAYLWFNAPQDPPARFSNPLQVYRTLFPDKPVWLDCACSLDPDAQTYFRRDSAYIQYTRP